MVLHFVELAPLQDILISLILEVAWSSGFLKSSPHGASVQPHVRTTVSTYTDFQAPNKRFWFAGGVGPRILHLKNPVITDTLICKLV